jgi:hypothetical protein
VSDSTLDVTSPAQVTDLSVDATPVTQQVAPSALASSGEVNATYGKDKAVDGNAATSWSTPGRTIAQEEFLTLDLLASHNLARVELCARDVTGALFPEDFVVELSTDNVSYGGVVSRVGFVAAAGSCHTFDFGPQLARYVRLRVTKARQYFGLFYVQLAEMKVFEQVTPPDTLTVTFTAPGDDGGSGTAASYDLRYSTSGITEGNFAAATPVPGAPAPSPAGATETIVVNGLTPGTQYFFAVKTTDDSDNTSVLSNVDSATTGSP